MKVLASMNYKGGVGKTTSSCAITELLAVADYKILFLDLDPQSNASRIFGIKEDKHVNYDLLLCRKSTKDEIAGCIHPSDFPNVDIIPSNPLLSDVVYDIYEKAKECNAEIFLKYNLATVAEKYDYVIIDTSPFQSYLSRCAIAAADKIFTPIDMDNFSYEGLVGLINQVDEINSEFSLNVEFGGVFMCRVKSRTTLFRQMHESYENMLGDIYIPVAIRDCTKVAEANTAFIPLWNYNRRCTAVMDYCELVNHTELMDQKHFHKFVLAMKGEK